MAVCEIFSIKNGATLKTGLVVVQGHWKWRCSIDHIRLSIGWPLYVWHYLYRLRDIGLKSQNFYIRAVKQLISIIVFNRVINFVITY